MFFLKVQRYNILVFCHTDINQYLLGNWFKFSNFVIEFTYFVIKIIIMKILKLFINCLIIFSVCACSPKSWQITSSVSKAIPVDKSTDALADKAYENFLVPYKQRVDVEMNIVIGQAAETMRAHAPESLLSNFSADVYRWSATAYLNKDVDIAIVNMGGLRTQIPAGVITVRKVFELMPFENELVVLWLKGDKLNELCQYFAGMGGEGVSGLRFRIENKKAVDITVAGEALDLNKTYSIATNDYLAGGNDKMIQLAQYTNRINTGIKIRNMLLDYIKNESKKGNMIQSKLDGRIK